MSISRRHRLKRASLLYYRVLDLGKKAAAMGTRQLARIDLQPDRLLTRESNSLKKHGKRIGEAVDSLGLARQPGQI